MGRKRDRRDTMRVWMPDGTIARGRIVRETMTGWLVRIGRAIVWRGRDGRP